MDIKQLYELWQQDKVHIQEIDSNETFLVNVTWITNNVDAIGSFLFGDAHDDSLRIPNIKLRYIDKDNWIGIHDGEEFHFVLSKLSNFTEADFAVHILGME